jgi:type IV secretory pathway VirB10-like protein
MGMPSSKDQDALDALFRWARAEPSAEDLHRAKQRLHALAAQVEAPPRRSGNGVLMSALVVIGCSLLLAPTNTVATDAPPAPAPSATATAPPEPAKVIETVPVSALSAAPEEPRAVPSVVPRPRHARAEAPPTPQPEPVTIVEDTPETRVEDTEAARQEGEASFLRRAKVALASDPGCALRMAGEHPTRYPRGVLIQEREVLAIEALVRLGRAEDARARAASFRSRYPSSAHHAHIGGLIHAAEAR